MLYEHYRKSLPNLLCLKEGVENIKTKTTRGKSAGNNPSGSSSFAPQTSRGRKRKKKKVELLSITWDKIQRPYDGLFLNNEEVRVREELG